MSQTKKIQNKIFRGETSNGEEPSSAGSRSSTDQPALTINIPKPTEQPQAQPRPKLTKTNGPSPSHEHLHHADSRSFRQRLAEQLGEKYHGAERFRLDQDVKSKPCGSCAVASSGRSTRWLRGWMVIRLAPVQRPSQGRRVSFSTFRTSCNAGIT